MASEAKSKQSTPDERRMNSRQHTHELPLNQNELSESIRQEKKHTWTSINFQKASPGKIIVASNDISISYKPHNNKLLEMY